MLASVKLYYPDAGRYCNCDKIVYLIKMDLITVKGPEKEKNQ